MQFVAITRRRTELFSEAQFTERLDAETDRVRALYAEGTIRTIYSRSDVAGAVILLEAADLGAAQAAVDSLPLAQFQMLETEVIPLRAYRGFVPAPK